MSRCTGHCCKRFLLPYSMEELQRMRQSIIDKKDFSLLDNGEKRFNPHNTEELMKVTGMVIFLGKSKLDPDGNSTEKECNYYTCKHFDEKSGNCMNYENRPRMCSDYPYGHKCLYKSCTLKTEVVEIDKEKILA